MSIFCMNEIMSGETIATQKRCISCSFVNKVPEQNNDDEMPDVRPL
ncbi:hypothetical protein [Mediterraneibacter gnavus]